MPRPRPLPPELSGGPFTTTEAQRAGVTRARLRAGDLSAPFHGVRASGPTLEVEDLARAFAPRLAHGQYFSHDTAAELLGMRMPEGFTARQVHVTSTFPRRAIRVAGAIGHQASTPALVRHVRGLPVSSPLDTWCQLASRLSLEDLIAAGDGLVRRRRPLSSLAELREAANSFEGRHARALREAAGHVRAGTDSHRETQLRRIVVAAGFPEPEVNGAIVNSYGAVIAHGDLVLPQYRVVIEYDGGHHRTDERQYHIDIDRLDAIMEEKWPVIRVNKALLARRATLIGKLDTALRQGGWVGSN